jgi:hypothetical protein
VFGVGPGGERERRRAAREENGLLYIVGDTQHVRHRAQKRTLEVETTLETFDNSQL